MFLLSPSERKVLILVASLIFLGTIIRYFNLEVKDVTPSSVLLEKQPLLIDLNKASAFELERLSGIGPVLSRRIIEYREKYGPFKEINDLKKVNGIGKHKAEAIKEYIEF